MTQPNLNSPCSTNVASAYPLGELKGLEVSWGKAQGKPVPGCLVYLDLCQRYPWVRDIHAGYRMGLGQENKAGKMVGI